MFTHVQLHGRLNASWSIFHLIYPSANGKSSHMIVIHVHDITAMCGCLDDVCMHAYNNISYKITWLLDFVFLSLCCMYIFVAGHDVFRSTNPLLIVVCIIHVFNHIPTTCFCCSWIHQEVAPSSSRLLKRSTYGFVQEKTLQIS